MNPRPRFRVIPWVFPLDFRDFPSSFAIRFNQLESKFSSTNPNYHGRHPILLFLRQA